MVAYFTLACSLAYATEHWDRPRWHHALLVIALAVAYGIVIEAGQALIPYRTDFLIGDVLANAVGASGAVAWYLVRPYVEWKPIPDLDDTDRT